MIPSSIRPFIVRLREETDNRKLEWIPAGGERAFSCAHKNHNMHIWTGFEENNEQMFISFQMSGKSTFRFSVDGNENDYDRMSDLLASIEINASKFDEKAVEDFFE